MNAQDEFGCAPRDRTIPVKCHCAPFGPPHAYLPGEWCPPSGPIPPAWLRDPQSSSGEEKSCICDGGSFEITRHPFIVHPQCAVHGNRQPTGLRGRTGVDSPIQEIGRT